MASFRYRTPTCMRPWLNAYRLTWLGPAPGRCLRMLTRCLPRTYQ